MSVNLSLISFVAGTTIKSADVNANFNSIVNVLNGTTISDININGTVQSANVSTGNITAATLDISRMQIWSNGTGNPIVDFDFVALNGETAHSTRVYAQNNSANNNDLHLQNATNGGIFFDHGTGSSSFDSTGNLTIPGNYLTSKVVSFTGVATNNKIGQGINGFPGLFVYSDDASHGLGISSGNALVLGFNWYNDGASDRFIHGSNTAYLMYLDSSGIHVKKSTNTPTIGAAITWGATTNLFT